MENEAWTAMGEVGHERVTYVVRLSPTWNVRQFLLFRDLDEPDLWLGTDGDGRWGEMNGSHRTELDGCRDLHLACSPFTDTIAIRRLQLDVGDAADVISVAVDVENLGVVPTRRRYEHVGPRRGGSSGTTARAGRGRRRPLRRRVRLPRVGPSRLTRAQPERSSRNDRRPGPSSGSSSPSEIDAVRNPSGFPVS